MDSPAVNPLAASHWVLPAGVNSRSSATTWRFRLARSWCRGRCLRNLSLYRPDTGPARSDMTGRCQMKQTRKAEVCLDEGKSTSSGTSRRAIRMIGCERHWLPSEFHLQCALMRRNIALNIPRIRGMSGNMFAEGSGRLRQRLDPAANIQPRSLSAPPKVSLRT
jgi:hypothetical protein